MKPTKVYLILLLVLLITSSSYCQQILLNPSFEGPSGMATVPPSWEPCGSGSTPDTQPGNWGVNTSPTDGSTYLCMVCRGTGGLLEANCEGIQQQLSQPLIAGKCYELSLDLAYSATMTAGYNHPVKLIVYGSTYPCGNEELLWESDKVENTEWKKVQLSIRPQSTIEYFILKAEYAAPQRYYGNIIIDDLSFTEIPILSINKLDTTLKKGQTIYLKAGNGSDYTWNPTRNLSCSSCQSTIAVVKDSLTYTVSYKSTNGCPVEERFILRIAKESIDNPKPLDPNPVDPRPVDPAPGEALYIPNVFTPNSDEFNDFFYIKGLTENSRLTILNRWGSTVFQTENYNNDWDGKNLPGGTYHYLFFYSKDQKYYKGWVEILR